MTHVTYHKPVLLNEAIRYLVTDPDGIYVDGTLGGGGHSAHILAHLSEKGRLYGIDQDDDALRVASERFAGEDRIAMIRGNFGYMDALLPRDAAGRLSGILLDLGVSSHQIDEPERGFSFQKDGPLDMRMGALQELTAAAIVNEYEYEELRNLFFEFGEERESGRIARAIIRDRPLQTTGQLRDSVASAVPERFLNKSLARIFQALRIAVNSELNMLKRALEKGTELLREEGRFVVITYHSLEDRLCKNYFRYGNFEGNPEKDFYGNTITPLQTVTRKVVTASDNEVAVNPRARSAKLRAAVKISQGWNGDTGGEA
jgi:16S rRNA (cytosine1402-N4)-methyltransferase